MKTLKLLVGVFAIVAAIYLCWALIPPYFANYQFEDAIESEARLGTYSTRTDNDIKEAVFKKAQDLELPLTLDQIQVQRGVNGSGQGIGGVVITADYTVHVDIPGYPVDLHFKPGSKNKSIY
jgi:hypothetical protein